MPRPADVDSVRRFSASNDFGPGIAVTNRRS